jgi:hypothetical protein
MSYTLSRRLPAAIALLSIPISMGPLARYITTSFDEVSA